MRGSRKPSDPGQAARRDSRVDPDDKPSAPRIDVVHVESRAGREAAEAAAGAAMMTLRRELARLTQQASAVEQTLEDQRRERDDAVERLARATERATSIEERLAALEDEARSLRRMHEAAVAELRSVRVERDAAESEVEALRAELVALRAKQELGEERRAYEDRIADLERDLAEARRERDALGRSASALRDEILAAVGRASDAAASTRETSPPATVADAESRTSTATAPPPPRPPSREIFGVIDEGWSSAPPPRSRPSSMRPAAPHETLAQIHTAGTKPPPPPPLVEASIEPEAPHTIAAASANARESLLAALADGDGARDAAVALRAHPEWLRGIPPTALVAALASVDYDVDHPVFELARAWEREPMCHALIAAVRSTDDERLREHGAWLLKHLAAPSAWAAIADLARSDAEPVQVRRWLLEALDRLAASRAIGWDELGGLVEALAADPDPNVREGVVGVLRSLERSEKKRDILLGVLRRDDDEVVIASAVHALSSVLPLELDPSVVERLLGHESPRVQRSIRELVARAKSDP